MTRNNVPTARAIADPRQMPALRQQLLDFAEPGGAWEMTERERAMVEVAGFGTARTIDPATGSREIVGPRGWTGDELPGQITLAQQRGEKSMDWHRRTVEEAQLVYVTADLVDLIEQAAAAVPDDLTLTLDDLPAPCGLVVLGRPLYGTDAGPDHPGKPIRFDALVWGTARLPPADTDWLTAGTVFTEDALSVGVFRFIDDDPDEADDMIAVAFHHDTVRDQLPVWLPLGRSDWPYGKPVEFKHRVDIPETALASMVEDRRVIAALFAVLNQRRIVHVETVSPSRQVRRHAERKGRKHPDVVVVHLRRTEYVPSEPQGDGRHVTVRFPVRSFYRRQPFGPRAEGRRKIVLVPGHWRGPEGAPVVHVERVWSLDR